MSKNDMQFGCMNTETGDFQEGYIEDGQMKFKKSPWWAGWFSARPTKTKYIGITTLLHGWIFSKNKDEVEVTVYCDYNPYTFKVYKVYCEHGNFNVDAYRENGRLVWEGENL